MRDNKINKIKYLNFLSLTLLIFSTLLTKEIIYLFYDINESPDIDKYIIYIDHFFNNITTDKEHGLAYYYLHAINLNIFYNDFSNIELALHKSILNINLFIYIYGLLGYFLLLKKCKFKSSTIFFTLIFLNFFPPILSMRMMLKPEILAFSLLPWILYLIEEYKSTNKLIHLILATPLLVGSVTLKGNILVIFLIYLLTTNYKILFNLKFKQLLTLLTIFILMFMSVSFENNISNGKNILDIQSGSSIEENYNYKANKNIIYKVDMYQLISSPIKHNHADSFISITLLETNGDYFDLFWDNNASAMFEARKPFITFIQSDKLKKPEFDNESQTLNIFRQRNTDVYLYETIGLLLSIYLFYQLIKQLLFDKKYRNFYVGVLIGMCVILFHAITGVPKNNFDPLVGDTFKIIYYVFVFSLSFVFVIARKLDDGSFKPYGIVIYGLITLFILGFPKISYEDTLDSIVPKLQSSSFCSIEKNIIFGDYNLEEVKCEYIEKSSNLTSNFKKINHKPINFVLIVTNLLISLLTTVRFFNKRTG